MKKKILVGILVLTMLIACVAVSASAASTKTEYVDEHGWDTVAADESSKYEISDDGSTVTLKEDITITSFIQLKSGSLTINLANHKITRSGGTVFNLTAGTLTVNGPGEITATGSGTMIVVDGADTKATFDNVTVTSSDANDNAALIPSNQATVTINGGSFKSKIGTAINAQTNSEVLITGTKINITGNGKQALLATGAKITATDVIIDSKSTDETGIVAGSSQG